MTRLICVLLGHATTVTYTTTEGLVQCARCGTVTDRWPALRPEDRHREQRRSAAFWAEIASREQLPPLRRVK